MQNATSIDPAQAVEQARQAVESAATKVASGIADAASAVQSGAADSFRDIREAANSLGDQAQARVRSARRESEAFVRTHPLRTALSCLAIGFCVGLIFRR